MADPKRGDYNGAGKVYDGRSWVDPSSPSGTKVDETATSGATTKGKNLGALGKSLTSDAPKQEPGETPAQFAEKFRKYRESRTKK